jgi:hypothetical protein
MHVTLPLFWFAYLLLILPFVYWGLVIFGLFKDDKRNIEEGEEENGPATAEFYVFLCSIVAALALFVCLCYFYAGILNAFVETTLEDYLKQFMKENKTRLFCQDWEKQKSQLIQNLTSKICGQAVSDHRIT